MTVLYLTTLLAFFFLGWVSVRRTLKNDSFWVLLPLSGILGLAFLETVLGIIGRVVPWNWALVGGGFMSLLLGFWLWKNVPPESPTLRFRFQFSKWDALWLFVFLVSLVLVIKMSLRFSINDEVGMQGHQSVVETILRGNFPPSFIAFPEIPYRYHYGFNLVAAAFSLALSVPGYLGMDVEAILLWGLMWGGMAVLLRVLGLPRKYLALGLLFLVFAGGWSWFLAKSEPGGYGAHYQAPHWQLMYIRHRFIAPNLVVYFFQHPMSLGIPLLCGSLVYFESWTRERRLIQLVLATLLLGALSLAQIMLFLTALASYGLVFLFNFWNPEFKKKETFISGLLMGGVAIAMAFVLGGFFSFSPGLDPQPLHFSWPPGYLRHEYWGRRVPISGWGAFVYYFSSFGWMLLLYPYAFYKGCRSKQPLVWFLTYNSAIGFLFPQLFQYQYTWDIIKWFVAFELSGRFLILWAYQGFLQKNRLLHAVAWMGVLFGMVTPARYLWSFAMKDFQAYSGGERQYTRTPQPKISQAWHELFATMRRCSACYGMVWSPAATSRIVSPLTGYPGLHLDYNTTHLGVAAEPIQKRKRDLAKLTTAPDFPLLKDLGIRWVIFPCADFSQLSPSSQAWLRDLRNFPGVKDYSHSKPGRDCFRAYYLSPDFFYLLPSERPKYRSGTKEGVPPHFPASPRGPDEQAETQSVTQLGEPRSSQ